LAKRSLKAPHEGGGGCEPLARQRWLTGAGLARG